MTHPDAGRYYEIFGLGPEATQEEVKQAFREMARRWHPDTVLQNPELLPTAQEKMRELNAAYEFLRSHPAGDNGETGAARSEEAEALQAQIRAIERFYLETLEQRRRAKNGLCRECGLPLTGIEKLLGKKSHGRCISHALG